MSPTPDDFDRVLATANERFRTVLEQTDPDLGVPTCDPWTAADLLWHLTEVQNFWANVVAGRAKNPESVARISRPADYAATLSALDAAAQALRSALADADDGEPVWTWSDDHTVGFIRRRQAHEALIHRVDAELAAGVEVFGVEPEIAADGVEEVLSVMIDGVPPWGSFDPENTTIRLECLDTPGAWRLRFGRFRGTSPDSGNTYDLDTAALDGDGPADCTVRSSAWTMDRWMWGRVGSAELEVDGVAALAERLRSIAAESTQ